MSVEPPIVCWIASYPRSGNTFLRFALSNILIGPGKATSVDEDFPEYVARKGIALDRARRFAGDRGSVVFCKTHHDSVPDVTPVKETYGIYIYRHPLDVFLSCLNFLYINSNREHLKKYFIDSRPKTVEQIAADGELDLYFQRMLEDDGISVFRPMAGRWSQSLTQWSDAAAASSGRLVCHDYVDVIGRADTILADLFERLGLSVPASERAEGLRRTREGTKADGGFFWRGKPGTYRDFLTEAQIDRFFARYEPIWSRLGITFPR